MNQSRQILCGQGHVSAVVHRPRALPPGGTTVVLLAHGAGGNMDNALLIAGAERCASDGMVAVRYNFPYSEAGRRAPDRMPVLECTVRDVVAWARDQKAWNLKRLVVGGKSMGSRGQSLRGGLRR